MLAMASPAAADIWWETPQGSLMWSDTIGGTGVFTYANDTGAVFIDGIGAAYDAGQMYNESTGWIETFSGTYNGYWYDHDQSLEIQCAESRTDPYGRTTQTWGTAQFVFSDLRHFAFNIGSCTGPLDHAFDVTPGL